MINKAPIIRYSRLFAPTLKAAPADAVAASHRLLVRAGFIRALGAGIYSYLPLAWRTLARIQAIVREEMGAIGGQEFLLPALQPADVWRESGRWETVGDEMFRLRDRRGGEYCLGMTHEEVFTCLARGELRSYRNLPQIWYQIQTKFRDEPRPRAGLLRVREFLMKDSYSFDADATGLDRAYTAHREAYQRIFRRCGLTAFPVEAHSGAMGGRESQEFMVRTEVGEDLVAACPEPGCGYAANLETATSCIPPTGDPPEAAREVPEPFATPGVVTIEALAGPPHFVPPERQLKTLVYITDGAPVIAVVRGDHALSEAKLQTATGTAQVRQARRDEILPLMGAQAGSLGAVGPQRAPVLVDRALAGRAGMVTGANRDGFHLRGVAVERDILARNPGARLVDLRVVEAGDGCPRCERGALEVFRALEVGHIFKLGTRYSAVLGATVLLADGSATPLVMGSYGIGIGRIMAAAVEQHHDGDGIMWPASIAPFDAAVLALGHESEVVAAAEQAAEALAEVGLEVLLDDRDERPGVKLKDADLVGLPLRVAVGARSVARQAVEWKRRDAQGQEVVPLEEVEAWAREWRRQPAVGSARSLLNPSVRPAG